MVHHELNASRVLSYFTGKPFLAYLAGYVHAWTFRTWAIQHSVRLGPLNSYTGLTLHTMRREALEQVEQTHYTARPV